MLDPNLTNPQGALDRYCELLLTNELIGFIVIDGIKLDGVGVKLEEYEEMFVLFESTDFPP